MTTKNNCVRKVYETTYNGQLLVSLPKSNFKAGDYVIVDKLNEAGK